jgi:class 3 adenylate cyclase
MAIAMTTFSGNIIVTTTDMTQTVMYNRLITDERAKSDQLLSSILPAKLVPRVQAGEKNISFSVQSATIVFMDIVSFTPWCGSLPAATVMKTLNVLFKEFDALVGIHVTMTKMKCIGDCYMAAGGIFMDPNQPDQHAKDVVDFGFDAIAALQKLNAEIDQALHIRVGVNTGGPVVAGVLGTAKPTFEILGPAINMAQQMEHHGVPMKVHVSRAVYELIYGGPFAVKERETDLKNGKTVTYVVDKI